MSVNVCLFVEWKKQIIYLTCRPDWIISKEKLKVHILYTYYSSLPPLQPDN